MVSIVAFLDDEDCSSTVVAAVDAAAVDDDDGLDNFGNGIGVFHRRGLKLNDTKKESYCFFFLSLVSLMIPMVTDHEVSKNYQ